MKLEPYHSQEDKDKWKIVRRDTLQDVPYDKLISADEETGECSFVIGGETKSQSFGFRGIKLCGKR